MTFVMALFMTILMLIGTAVSIFNAVIAYRRSNREAAIAWVSSAIFALALVFRNLGDVFKSVS